MANTAMTVLSGDSGSGMGVPPSAVPAAGRPAAPGTQTRQLAHSDVQVLERLSADLTSVCLRAAEYQTEEAQDRQTRDVRDLIMGLCKWLRGFKGAMPAFVLENAEADLSYAEDFAGQGHPPMLAGPTSRKITALARRARIHCDYVLSLDA